MRINVKSSEVSNPISGEVGAAAGVVEEKAPAKPAGFKPHQRGGGCCSSSMSWELPLAGAHSFKPHQRGGGCCSVAWLQGPAVIIEGFQTPSAGRWVLQLGGLLAWATILCRRVFQTPSAGRWVLQRPLGWLGSRTPTCFKPHQRGGGCCSGALCGARGAPVEVSNPISGEVGAAATRQRNLLRKKCSGFKPHQRGGGCCSSSLGGNKTRRLTVFQTPSAGRWVLQPHRGAV